MIDLFERIPADYYLISRLSGVGQYESKYALSPAICDVFKVLRFLPFLEPLLLVKFMAVMFILLITSDLVDSKEAYLDIKG